MYYNRYFKDDHHVYTILQQIYKQSVFGIVWNLIAIPSDKFFLVWRRPEEDHQSVDNKTAFCLYSLTSNWCYETYKNKF
jgi:hypothetical protein